MLNDMPGKIIKHHKDMTDINLDEFFGFVKVEVETLSTLDKPLLPYRQPDTGRVIYPKGKWIGTYFSELLKGVQPYGYKFTLIEGSEHERIKNLFNNYNKHFYSQKVNATGASRFIAKLHLNCLYGVFGRRLDNIQTLDINIKELSKYLASRLIKNYIEIDDNTVTLLMYTDIKTNILDALNT